MAVAVFAEERNAKPQTSELLNTLGILRFWLGRDYDDPRTTLGDCQLGDSLVCGHNKPAYSRFSSLRVALNVGCCGLLI